MAYQSHRKHTATTIATWYTVDANGNQTGAGTFGWKCMDDGRFLNVDGGSTYVITMPDQDHFIMNGDTWHRVEN